jgi:hypothetical protein
MGVNLSKRSIEIEDHLLYWVLNVVASKMVEIW